MKKIVLSMVLLTIASMASNYTCLPQYKLDACPLDRYSIIEIEKVPKATIHRIVKYRYKKRVKSHKRRHKYFVKKCSIVVRYR